MCNIWDFNKVSWALWIAVAAKAWVWYCSCAMADVNWTWEAYSSTDCFLQQHICVSGMLKDERMDFDIKSPGNGIHVYNL